MSDRSTQNETRRQKSYQKFLTNAIRVHGDRYIYNDLTYHNTQLPTTIQCRQHGDFIQRPTNHIYGKAGCPLCHGGKMRDTASFIVLAKEVHGDKFDYSIVDYERADRDVSIICPSHGVFRQKPNRHLYGDGCNKCRPNAPIGLAEFVRRAQFLHGDRRYSYVETVYKNRVTPVVIICLKHGKFVQKPEAHLKGCGCPRCGWSKGEALIGACLERSNVEFTFQKTFDDCRSDKGRVLRFDFWIPHKSMLIEYDGSQHFGPVSRSRYVVSRTSVTRTQRHDSIKNDYAKDRGYTLIRIPYTSFGKIDSIISHIVL